MLRLTSSMTRRSGNFPDRRRFRLRDDGAAAAVAGSFFERIRSTVEVKEFKVARMIADGDTVAVFGSERFLVKRTGKEWAVDWVKVHEVRNGRIVRFREYTDTAAIAEAMPERIGWAKR